MTKKLKKWWWLKRLDIIMRIAKLCRIDVIPPHLGKIPSYVVKS